MTGVEAQKSPAETLSMLLRLLRLPSFSALYEECAAQAERVRDIVQCRLFKQPVQKPHALLGKGQRQFPGARSRPDGRYYKALALAARGPHGFGKLRYRGRPE